MLSVVRGRFLQHTQLGSLLPALLLVLSLSLFSACDSGSSSSGNDTAPADSANPASVTSGDGSVTIDNFATVSRSVAQTVCTYNVYIASESGVTNENYSSLTDGALYENISFPFTIMELTNGAIYYIVVYELCDGVETQVGKEVSVMPTAGTSGGDSSGIIPEGVDVTRVDADVESVTVQWRPPSDFKALTSADYSTTGYIVCFQEGASIGNGAHCAEDIWRGKNSFTFRWLKGGVQHCFGVKQWKDDIGASDFGDTMCATPTSAGVASSDSSTGATCGAGLSSFQAGDNFAQGYGNELPVHQVCLSSFTMDAKEVTQTEFTAWNGGPPTGGYGFGACGGDCPAENVTWQEASDYCTTQGKRLPTEAEWEYSARQGGQVVRYGTGSDSITTGDANYNNSTTVTVASYAPNSLGLYDMSGNVWEWVSDWYKSDYYTTGFATDKNDPQGPAGPLTTRVVRGGSWSDFGSSNLRVSTRIPVTPTIRINFLGFRCAQ